MTSRSTWSTRSPPRRATSARPRGRRRLDDRPAADLPLVRADPRLLHHCLLNLIDNALRYSPPRIADSHCRRGATATASRCRCIDEGPGAGRRAAARFDRFARIAGSDRKGGAGLGLAIVKGFAEAMGMAVEARNRDGGGRDFHAPLSRRRSVDERRRGRIEQRATRS